MPTAINWFEIPVANLDRAQVFLGSLLGGTLMDFGGEAMASLPEGNQTGLHATA
jgi:predicted enzyme related to lactoylglutathione lyase